MVPQNAYYLIGFLAFGYLWVHNFVHAVRSFTVMQGVIAWYFTRNSEVNNEISLFKGTKWALGPHGGSLSFGSLILAIVQALNDAAKRSNRRPGGGGIAGICVSCLMGCI
jgi:hypothetical protein